MNIIEETKQVEQSNPDVKGNMDASTNPSSAKKVYSKPTLHVISSFQTQNKNMSVPTESLFPPRSLSVGS